MTTADRSGRCAAPSCPACGDLTDPEQDGDLTYYACPGCGHEFGYAKRAAALTCPAGILLTPPQPAPLLLHIGKRPIDAATA